jgi:hypothetical protein
VCRESDAAPPVLGLISGQNSELIEWKRISEDITGYRWYETWAMAAPARSVFSFGKEVNCTYCKSCFSVLYLRSTTGRWSAQNQHNHKYQHYPLCSQCRDSIVAKIPSGHNRSAVGWARRLHWFTQCCKMVGWDGGKRQLNGPKSSMMVKCRK